MNIVEFFDCKFSNVDLSNSDYRLCKYKDDIYIGIDKDGNASVVIDSNGNNMNPIIQRTKMLSIECNMLVKYVLDETEKVGIVHIIKCNTSLKKERDIFLELSILLIESGEHNQDGILNVFRTLILFFSNNNEISDNELTGVYGELYTIKKYHDLLEVGKYWQSQDKMKFDFSFTDKVKLEVKSTTKPMRIHHFRHEQLMTDNYKIYVISYLFRRDDEGLSLFDLIQCCKNIFKNDSKKTMKLDLLLKNVDIDKLKDFKFGTNYTESNFKIYHGQDIPKFNEFTPDGVANAEYDCDMETAINIDENKFIEEIRSCLS